MFKKELWKICNQYHTNYELLNHSASNQGKDKSACITSTQHNIEVLANEIGQEKKKASKSECKKLNCLCPQMPYLFIYIRNLMEFTKQLIKPFNEWTQESWIYINYIQTNLYIMCSK